MIRIGDEGRLEAVRHNHELLDPEQLAILNGLPWRLEPEEVVAELRQAGYLDADELASWLNGFRKGPVTRFLGERGSQQLDRLMPVLLGSAAGIEVAQEDAFDAENAEPNGEIIRPARSADGSGLTAGRAFALSPESHAEHENEYGKTCA